MPEKPKEIYRVMPHNTDAEQALLGSILIDNRTADQLIPTLRAEDFYVSANRSVFAAMRDAFSQFCSNTSIPCSSCVSVTVRTLKNGMAFT